MTMKTTYISPAIEVINGKFQTILAGSEFSINSTPNSYTKNDFAAKNADLDFDDEDDEE